jgi:branched-chain amino acid transport system substrate-binding protein
VDRLPPLSARSHHHGGFGPRRHKALGVRIPYTGRVELGGRNQPIIEAGGMEKSISAWTYNSTIDAPSNKAFAEAIKAKYKSEPCRSEVGAASLILIPSPSCAF